jgi:superfamily II DNA/RNA helicase
MPARTSSRPTSARPSSRRSDEFEALFAASTAPAADGPVPSFHSLGLPQRLVTALERRGISTPFPIQAAVLPDALAGRDVLGRGQTGSGKTLGFGLPLLARLAAAGRRRTPHAPAGLVLVPTRELAGQVHDALAPLGHALDVRLGVIVGGASMYRQIEMLRRGVDVVVATPGRLLDLVDRGEVRLDAVAVTVLDEADYMADLGFLPAVTRLLDLTPADGQRLLFSATLDDAVRRLVTRYLTDPAAHAVAPAAAPVSAMEHRALVVGRDDKLAVVAEIAARPARTLLFVRTKHGADRLATQLRRQGVEAGAIHGNLTQNARQRALEAFNDGRARVLVATDVAARGIHVDDLDLVVHVDPPADSKDYLHRSGRTARAGASGLVLSLLLPDQVRDAARLHNRAGVTPTVTRVHPGHPAVREVAESGTPVRPRPTRAPEPARRPRQEHGSPPPGRPSPGRRTRNPRGSRDRAA